MERAFRKALSSLQQIFAFVDEATAACGADPAAVYAVTLAIEEFFTNMVKYSTESAHDVIITITCRDRVLTVSLTDRDVEPFDVTRAPEANVSAGLDQRRPGGLGIHLSRELLDSLQYQYQGRVSTIMFTKALEK